MSDDLVGFFGHSYVRDKDADSDKGHDSSVWRIHRQFKIIRKINSDPVKYAVQLFSWLDGRPTELEFIAERKLMGSTVKLYETEGLWREACNQQRGK